MPDFYSAYWEGLKDAIHAAWPEVATLFADSQIERRDWINDINTPKLALPYCVVRVDFAQETGWGMGRPRYRMDARISYIGNTAFDKALAPHATSTGEFLAARLVALRQALYASEAIGTVLPEMPLDNTASDEINRVLLDAKIPFQAASLTASSIVVDRG